MGHIKLDNEIIPERRQGNGRIKLDTGDWVKIATVIIALILTGGKMNWDIGEHSKVIASQELKIESVTKTTNDNKKDIESMCADIGEIKVDVKALLKRK